MPKKMKGDTVCVTGASGFIASWLVMRLIERGYFIRATVRNPGNIDKVKHLFNLPNASTHLSLWKADLVDEGSFDEVIQGCTGVFHVATPADLLSSDDHENGIIKPTINGVLNIMRSCVKGKTVRRFIYTSSTSTITIQSESPLKQYDESCWTDADFCYAQKMPIWSYYVAKTKAERAAWEFTKENGLNLITVHPSAVIGPFLTSSLPPQRRICNSYTTGNKALYKLMTMGHAVHLEDVCDARIFLFEHPEAHGRYICSNHDFIIFDLVKSLGQKYPECNIPTEFEGVEESLKVVPCSSKKSMDLGFKFRYDSAEYNMGDLCAEVVEFCRRKGVLP
ncbi:dihydroflavonol 4-reductase-like [Jatropha curcas]|uniref:dihydroflavonol 4-reductase-like n=1 Tax=Jatropha curcas TaxID=180498 RepID=UPI001895E8B5|nr:dihydroflavonol 4-reductase-like [Jatropha curcas]